MQRAVLLSAAAVLVLVPGCAAVCVALFPHHDPILPFGFWLLWLVFSLCTILYAPAVIGRLTPKNGNHRQCAIYARWGMALGFINMAWSAVEVLFLR